MAKSNSRIPKVYRDFLKQPAQLSKEQAEDIDRMTLDPTSSYSVYRRIALASLTRSGAELAEGMEDAVGAAAMAEAAVQIDRYVERLKSLIEMMTAASVRIELALCKRPDMELLLEQARCDSDLRVQ